MTSQSDSQRKTDIPKTDNSNGIGLVLQISESDHIHTMLISITRSVDTGRVPG